MIPKSRFKGSKKQSKAKRTGSKRTQRLKVERVQYFSCAATLGREIVQARGLSAGLQQSGEGTGVSPRRGKQTGSASSRLPVLSRRAPVICRAKVACGSKTNRGTGPPKEQQGRRREGARAPLAPGFRDRGCRDAWEVLARPRGSPFHGPFLKWAHLRGTESDTETRTGQVTTSAEGSARATQCGAWCAGQPPPGAGRTPAPPSAPPTVAYRSCPAGPAARCSRDTPSCTAAATAPEGKRRVPPLHDSCLRIAALGRPGAPH